MKTWLVIDVNYMCSRSFHAMKMLSFGEDKTGVVFGFFRDLIYLQDLHNTNRLVFCFDKGPLKRQEVYAEYKANRRIDISEEEQASYDELQRQIRIIRSKHLPKLGYRNVFCVQGFEADDLVASVCQESIGEKDRAIIVSADNDLYQLLDSRISLWCPRQKMMITEDRFIIDNGVEPKQWPYAKSLAGDSGDNVTGIKGVGIKSACRYINGTLKTHHKVFSKIEQGILQGVPERNLRVVKLPFEGTPVFKLKSKEKFNKGYWKEMTTSLGMESLTGENLFRSY